MKDFKSLQQDPPSGVSAAPTDNNIMLWNAVIFGWVGDHAVSPMLLSAMGSSSSMASIIGTKERMAGGNKMGVGAMELGVWTVARVVAVSRAEG